MMIEVSYLREKEILKTIPQEVQETIEGILQILDSQYRDDRNKYEDDGGYVIVVEKIREILMREINKRIRDFCKERILLNDKQAGLWNKAYYDRRGYGSTISRTYDIKEINENAVPRYIISDENKSLKEFIFLLRKEILEVFKEINSRYKTRIDLD